MKKSTKKRKKPALDPLELAFKVEPPQAEVKSPNWGGPSFPDKFGYATLAKPRPGEPDLSLAANVEKVLYGVVDPTKRVTGIKTVVTYADGVEHTIYDRQGSARVFITSNPEMPGPKLSVNDAPQVHCLDIDSIRIEAFVKRDRKLVQPQQAGLIT